MPLDSKTEAKIDGVFAQAVAEGRNSLHEFEVYRILEALGLRTPQYAYVKNPEEVDAALLAPFSPKAIVKIVSPDLAHKSKYGGVRSVNIDDYLYVRYVLNSMRSEVASHFSTSEQPRIDGFLIAEFVPFTQSLGSELLIGIKEDPAFGPTLTMSKGGDDAEFFAKWYDPANISLAPLSRAEADTLARSLKIRHKFEAEGHTGYCGLIADAVYAIGQLAAHYSFTASKHCRYNLTQMDINPFVFSKAESGALIAVDGFAQFEASCEDTELPPRPDASSIKAFFEPKGLAVAGVSSDAGKYSMARIIVQILADLGRKDVYCLNPKGGETDIDGRIYPLYKEAAALPVPCSLYVFAAPASHTVSFLETVPDNTAVILISGIPAELKPAEFSLLINRHRSRGVRIIGPNCMGVFFAPDAQRGGVNTLFLGEERLKIGWTGRSNVALFTQSGAMGITAVERAANAPVYKAIVSFGNKADVNVANLLRYFEKEASVKLMAMYLEGFAPGEGRDFFDLAKVSKKPIVVYKAGRTAAGAKAAASHTASMSGDYDVFQAACEQAGVVLIDELPDFYHAVKAFSMLSDKPPQGLRVAGVVNAGLDATMGADQLGSLVSAIYQTATNRRLEELNLHGLLNVGASFLDVTPMTGDQLFADIVEAVLSDPGVDCAFVAVVPHVETLKTTDDVCDEKDALAALLVDLCHRHKKPVVVSVNSGNRYQGFVRALEEGGLPVFPDIRSAMRALETFCTHQIKKM
ncbi:acetate--CoA ligase family protein [Treponema sp.]